ncbi:MAG: PQQ-binding-like beta-propeller repeat protein, partial [Lentisphaerae bacterium]|nr:PQQ-binding-like beta-propeller repeat protein [Lentisphaerota bacterium]
AEAASDVLPDFAAWPPPSRRTALVVDGRAPVILAPAHAAGQAAAKALQEALTRRLGVAPPLATTLEQAEPGRQTCIALGNMLDNPLLTRLYFSSYTYEDAQYPGGDGFTLRTVCDPHHWGGGKDVIVVGASQPQALSPAVARLLEALEGEGAATTLPWTLVVEPSRALAPAAREALLAKPVDPSFTAFRVNAEAYLKTGDETHARLALAALDIMAGVYERQPDRKAPWPEETTSGAIAALWDAFDECPLISAERRAAYLKAFFLWSRDLTRRSYEYRLIDEAFTVTWNHTTFALLGLYHAGRYFDRHFQIPEAAEWLRRSRLGFAAQAQSWKPQEDADSYLVLTMDHVIRYALAEWDLRFFESGLLQRYADYVVACGDNRLLPAGFGDSGYSVVPTMVRQALPIAFWWTRDSGYRWLLDQAHPGGWSSPTWQDVAPTPPERFVGLRVFPIDPRLYADIQRRPSYTEAFAPAEVAVEQAWDKISFRENWDPAGQYLLLDGIGRGKHLHFDTNGITTFVQDGERWLLDHDYLVRNTTEHSMLSVLRDGRCDVLVPSLAGLAAAGEIAGLAATRTTVAGYNGVDWDRQVLWRRGAWFVVRDVVRARQDGDYDLDVTWKTIDSGDQAVDAAGRFTARRATAFESQGLEVIDDAAASTGRAVLLSEAASRLVFPIELAAGDYEVVVVGYGDSGSSDSLFLDLDGGPTLDLHLPQETYGPSRSTFAGTSAARLTVAAGGRHRVRVALREKPSVHLDRIEFRPAGAAPQVVVAATAPPLRPEDLPPASVKALHIDSAEPVSAWVTNHVRQGISVPVSILHQRQSRRLAAGDEVVFCSLVHAVGEAHSDAYAMAPAADGAYRVAGPAGAVGVRFGAGRLGLWEGDAEAWILDSDGLRAVALASLRQGTGSLRLEPPAAVHLETASGRLTVEAAVPTRLTASGWTLEADGKAADPAVALPAGRHVLSLRGLTAAASPDLPVVARPAAGADGTPAAPALSPLWTLALSAAPVARLTPADLDGDGQDELLVACGRTGFAVGADGRQRWSCATGGVVRDVSLAHLKQGGPGTVLVSSADTTLRQLDPGGRELRRDVMTGIYFSADHGERPWGLYCSRGVDSDADGVDDMIITTLASMEAQGRSPDGQKLWRTLAAYHGCMEIAVQDLDQDGRPEIVIANKYGSVYVLRPDGRVVLSSLTSIGDVTFGLGDLDGDGKTDIVHGSSTGDLMAVTLGRQTLWRFDNFGYPVSRIVCHDLDGDGRPEVLVGSGTGYLYCLSAAGDCLWAQRLGLAVHDLAVIEGRLLAGTEDGLLHALDAQGRRLWSRQAGAAVLKLSALRVGGRPAVVAGLADGRVVAAGLEP